MRGRDTKTSVRSTEPVHHHHDRKPSPVPPFIDQEFENIINKECPGKLYRLLKQRIKKRVVTQPTVEISHDNQHQMQIFQRTFYKERLKTAEKDRRVQSMRDQLKVILRTNERPPSPFFKINRKNILGLERSSIDYQPEKSSMSFISERSLNKINLTDTYGRSTSKGKPKHPYMKIAEGTSHRVSQQITRRSKELERRIIEFQPFGDIKPVDILY